MRATIFFILMAIEVSGCGGSFPDCSGTWESLDDAKYQFIHSDRTEAKAQAIFGEPSIKTTHTFTNYDGSQYDASIWRWDIKNGGDFCGKWWVEFPPAIIVVGREDAFPSPSILP
jgi:hypothetical protein